MCSLLLEVAGGEGFGAEMKSKERGCERERACFILVSDGWF